MAGEVGGVLSQFQKTINGGEDSESPFSYHCASTQLPLRRALLRVHGFDNLKVCEKARQKK
jgi:hypothetical protein